MFRAWVRHTGVLIGSREARYAAYLCRRCAERQVAGALTWTGLLGWWSISSFFLRAPRATFYNWIAAFRAPLHPLAWGAIPVAEVLHDLQTQQEAYERAAASEVLADSPFPQLSNEQASRVFSAEHLYETLQISSDASSVEIRHAYTARAREVHPDLRPEDASANEAMIQVNQAWEILRNERMRAAYDWLEENRAYVA